MIPVTVAAASSSPLGAAELFNTQGTEYEFAILDPDTPYGTPYGGYSRATASRLASLPLELFLTGDEVMDFEPMFFQVRDFMGRPFSCRVYHEDELEASSLKDSMFDLAQLQSESVEPLLVDPSEAMLPEAVAKESTTLESEGSTEITPSSSEDSSSVQSYNPDERGTSEVAATEVPAEEGAPADDNSNTVLLQKLSQLTGLCSQLHQGWWSYEWCYEEKVAQFHVEIESMGSSKHMLVVDDLTSLGEFHERSILTGSDIPTPTTEQTKQTKKKGGSFTDPNQAVLAEVHDVYLNGDICPDTGKPRQTKAILRCCSPQLMKMVQGATLYNGMPFQTDLVAFHSVSESDDTPCVYTMTLCTPVLCAEEVSAVSVQQSAPTTKSAGTLLTVEQIESMTILEIIDVSFSRASRKECIQFGSGGWWVYEFCPGEYVRQFHEVTLMDRISGASTTAVETEHMLGKYDEAENGPISKEDEYKRVMNVTSSSVGPGGVTRSVPRAPVPHGGNGAYYFQEYSGGDMCEHEDVTGSAIKAGTVGSHLVQRSTTVQYGCGSIKALTVKEDSTCHYIAHVSVPALCYHPLFKAPISKRQIVKCLPST